MEKKCFKCKRTKELSAFYIHPQMADGHLNKCKDCTKTDVRRRYYDPAFRKQIAIYEHKRARDPERKRRALEYQRLHRLRYPGKYRARQRINNSLRAGRLSKEPCIVCGSHQVEAHHTDYRRPLVVQWLCKSHHMEAENKQKLQG